MKQLVELQKNHESIEQLNAQVIIVFREESKGIEGLEIIRDRTQTTFELALDLNKESSNAYSSKRGTFDNYIITADGLLSDVIDGTLTDRAKSMEIVSVLEELESVKATLQ